MMEDVTKRDAANFQLDLFLVISLLIVQLATILLVDFLAILLTSINLEKWVHHSDQCLNSL